MILIAFVFNVFSGDLAWSYGLGLSAADLPRSDTLLSPTDKFVPLTLRGIRVDKRDPFKFSFIVDEADTDLTSSDLEKQSTMLLRYFLGALAMPEDEIWVNLSPYEPDRVVPDQLLPTDIGRDMLAQDYLLKQLASSLTFPQSKSGRNYWQALTAKGGAVNSFNKVWIVPDKAVIYQNDQGAFIKSAHLKVLTESDYLARQKNSPNKMEFH